MRKSWISFLNVEKGELRAGTEDSGTGTSSSSSLVSSKSGTASETKTRGDQKNGDLYIFTEIFTEQIVS